MKINFTSVKLVENAYKTQSLNKYSKEKVSNNKDRVELSETAKYLSEISKDNEKIDEKKINELKSKLNSGTYNIDSKDIAKKILEHITGEKK